MMLLLKETKRPMQSKNFSSTDSMLVKKGYGLINPMHCSDSEYSKLEKATLMLKGIPMFTQDTFSELFTPQIGYSFYVTLEDLLNSYQNEQFHQYSIKPGNVINLLTKSEDGLLLGHKLSRHIEVAYMEDNLEGSDILDPSKFVIGGGRHRLCAIIFAVVMSWIWDSGADAVKALTTPDELAALSNTILADETIRSLQVPVVPVPYDIEYIRRSNQSRRWSSSENSFIKLQSVGVEATIIGIATAILDKRINVGEGWGDMFSLLAQIDPDTLLESQTAFNLGKKVYNHLKRSKFLFPNSPVNLEKLVTALWEALPPFINELKRKGCTNIARYGLDTLMLELGAHALHKSEGLWSPEPAKPTPSNRGRGRKKGTTVAVVPSIAEPDISDAIEDEDLALIQ